MSFSNFIIPFSGLGNHIFIFRLPLLPAFFGILLHVCNGVFFINYFNSKQGFYDIFHGNNTVHASVFVHYQSNMFLFFKQLFPKAKYLLALRRNNYLFFNIFEVKFKVLVRFSQFFKDILPEYVTGNII